MEGNRDSTLLIFGGALPGPGALEIYPARRPQADAVLDFPLASRRSTDEAGARSTRLFDFIQTPASCGRLARRILCMGRLDASFDELRKAIELDPFFVIKHT